MLINHAIQLLLLLLLLLNFIDVYA